MKIVSIGDDRRIILKCLDGSFFSFDFFFGDEKLAFQDILQGDFLEEAFGFFAEENVFVGDQQGGDFHDLESLFSFTFCESFFRQKMVDDGEDIEQFMTNELFCLVHIERGVIDCLEERVE